MSESPSRACYLPRCPCNGKLHRRSRSREQSRADTSHLWRTESKAFLAKPENHRCTLRTARTCTGKGETVDHIRPPKGDMALYWDQRNWRAACNPCNATREVREGFGLEGSWYARRTK